MAESGKHVTVALLLATEIGGEWIRTDRRGGVTIRWGEISARVSLAGKGLADQELVRIEIKGGGLDVPFEGSATNELIKNAARSIRRRFVRAQRRKDRAHGIDSPQVQALATMAAIWPRLSSPSRSKAKREWIRIGALVLSIDEEATVQLKLDAITAMDPADAAKLAKRIHEALVEIVGEAAIADHNEAEVADE